MKPNSFAFCCISLSFSLLTSFGWAQVNEDANERFFDGARQYTVQVRASVPRPFEPDSRGTYRGAGFVIDSKRGWVLTNAHVVARSPSRVEVAAYGQAYVPAKKLYVDPHLDLAVLELPADAPRPTTQAQLDCGELPKTGHPVGAFGHPWNLSFTGTKGIISGVTVLQGTEMLQTDAPINGGNSGGPLLSLRTGKIVGINTAQIRGSQNTNFAVGMKYACRVVELLKANKDPSPPNLQVAWYQDVDNEKTLRIAKYYGNKEGIVFQNGDTVIGLPGASKAVENETQLYHELRGWQGNLHLQVRRDGHLITLSGKTQPYSAIVQSRGLVAGGVLFGKNPLRDAEEIHASGLMVHSVEIGSDGEAKELQRGDFLQYVNGRPVRTLEALYEQLKEAKGSVSIAIKRMGNSDRAFVYIERKLDVHKLEWVDEYSLPQSDGSTENVLQNQSKK